MKYVGYNIAIVNEHPKSFYLSLNVPVGYAFLEQRFLYTLRYGLNSSGWRCATDNKIVCYVRDRLHVHNDGVLGFLIKTGLRY